MRSIVSIEGTVVFQRSELPVDWTGNIRRTALQRLKSRLVAAFGRLVDCQAGCAMDLPGAGKLNRCNSGKHIGSGAMSGAWTLLFKYSISVVNI